MTDMLETDAYLIVEGRRGYGNKPPVVKIVAVGVRQNPPALERDQVTVRVRLQVPRTVFDPVPTPATTITLVDPRQTPDVGVLAAGATAVEYEPEPIEIVEPGSGTDPQQWHR